MLVLSSACGGPKLDAGSTSVASVSAAGPSLAPLLAAADARILSPELRAAAFAADLATRQLATSLLARIEVDAALPLLELALGDRDGLVRLHAVHGLARHPALQPSQREAILLGAYAAATAAPERASLLGLLADTVVRADSPVVVQAFAARDDVEPMEREASCGALARLARRGHVPSAVVLDRIPERLSASEPAVAALCANALADPRLAAALSPPVKLAAVRALRELAAHADATIAVPALVALPVLIARDAVPVLEAASGSSETRIALEAVRQLGSFLSPTALVVLIHKELDRQLASPALLGGPRLHVLLAALLAAERYPNDSAIAELADHALARLQPAALAPGSKPDRPGSGRALAHCAAARLRDMTRKWPGKLLECGGGRVPDALRDTWSVAVLARATDSDGLRATQLGRFFDKGPRAVRLAVLSASSTLPIAEALALLTRALGQSDPVVLAAAARALTARGADVREKVAETPLPAALASAFGASEGTAESAIAWLEAVVATVGRPSAPHRALLEVIAGPGAERIGRLARSPVPSVREPARRMLAEWELSDPGAALPVSSALPVDRWPAPRSAFHVKLVTTAGALQLALDVDRAPAAAVRFVALARSGALDNLPIASLTPGRSIELVPLSEAALPALREEPVLDPVQRGSVLLLDHGRDAVGSGFAIILERSPQLDRRATMLGRIISNVAVADALTPADRILEAQVTIK